MEVQYLSVESLDFPCKTIMENSFFVVILLLCKFIDKDLRH